MSSIITRSFRVIGRKEDQLGRTFLTAEVELNLSPDDLFSNVPALHPAAMDRLNAAMVTVLRKRFGESFDPTQLHNVFNVVPGAVYAPTRTRSAKALVVFSVLE